MPRSFCHHCSPYGTFRFCYDCTHPSDGVEIELMCEECKAEEEEEDDSDESDPDWG